MGEGLFKSRIFIFLISIVITITLSQITKTQQENNKNEMAARSILKMVSAVEKAEGAGATVRRSIGVRQARNFNPFLMFDHFSSGGSNGFPEHPHRGQETITLILNGAMAHEDFTGSKGILYAGDLQFMTAGKGVVHSEMPIPNEDGSPTVGLQLWVDLPKKLKYTAPRYRDLREWEIPEVVEQDGKLKIKVISGTSHGVESVRDLAYTPVHYYYYKMKPGATFKQDLDKGFNYFLYNLKGNSLILNGDTKVPQYTNVFFNTDGEYITGENVAKPTDENGDVEFVLIGGQQLDQDVIQYGPFVTCTREEVEKAYADYSLAQNGFENIATWKTLISNGVTKDMIEGPLDGNLEKRKEEKEEYLLHHKNEKS